MTAPENFKKSLPQLGEEVSRAQNPYIGPRPFADNEREQQLFFGREREGADLLSLVMADRSVLFYAPSGAGKSSLVNARLLPALRAEGFVVLGRARVGGQLPADLPVTAVANVYVYNLLRDLDPGHQGEVSLRRQRLPDFLAQGAGEESDRVLVIDQFEEIFTTYPEQWEKREDFFRQLSQALSADPRLWVILTMREDYIAELDPYARLLPNRLRVRYRLNYMDATAALAAVTKPAELGGRPFEPGVAERLVDNLRQRVEEGATESPAALGEMVEPVQLQVVCMQLWQRLLEEPGATITAEDVEKLARGAGLGEFVNHALASFYEQTLAAVVAATTTGVSERELRDWFSQRLITRDGTRNLLYQSDTETDTLPNPVALALEQSFLLRGETRGGGRWVELIHDRLIGPIREANERWRQAHSLVIAADLWNVDRSPSRLLHSAALAEAEQVLAATPHLYGPLEHSLVASSAAAEAERLAALQAREAAQQQEAKRDRLIAIGATVAAISMLLLLLLSLWFASQAAANYVRAQAEAVSRTLEAARARQLADTAREQAAAAEAARSAADAARVDAVQARARTEQLLRQIRGDQLASQAVFALSSRPQQALLLAVEAMRVGRCRGAVLAHDRTSNPRWIGCDRWPAFGLAQRQRNCADPEPRRTLGSGCQRRWRTGRLADRRGHTAPDRAGCPRQPGQLGAGVLFRGAAGSGRRRRHGAHLVAPGWPCPGCRRQPGAALQCCLQPGRPLAGCGGRGRRPLALGQCRCGRGAAAAGRTCGHGQPGPFQPGRPLAGRRGRGRRTLALADRGGGRVGDGVGGPGGRQPCGAGLGAGVQPGQPRPGFGRPGRRSVVLSAGWGRASAAGGPPGFDSSHGVCAVRQLAGHRG